MGQKTISGYPIPADKNPDHLPPEQVFPWDQAATLVTFAEQVGVDGVRAMVDTIHGLLGNPEAIPPVTDAWRKAVKELTASIDGSDHTVGLQTAKENLVGRWNGPAREAAVSYVERIIKTTEDTRNVVRDIAKEIDKFRSKIVDNYIQAIQHITNYASICLNLGGGILGAMAKATDFELDLKDVIGDITKALDDFMKEENAIIKEIIKFRDDIRTNVESIKTNAAQIAVPAAIAPAALDNDSWHPRKPDGSPTA